MKCLRRELNAGQMVIVEPVLPFYWKFFGKIQILKLTSTCSGVLFLSQQSFRMHTYNSSSFKPNQCKNMSLYTQKESFVYNPISILILYQPRMIILGIFTLWI